MVTKNSDGYLLMEDSNYVLLQTFSITKIFQSILDEWIDVLMAGVACSQFLTL